jgi:hypothetical protein
VKDIHKIVDRQARTLDSVLAECTEQKSHHGQIQTFFVVTLLVLLGVAQLATNRWLGAIDDECAIVDVAARPLAQTLHIFLSGTGQHEHPPLYDILLHVWLRITNGNAYLLRTPAILFYITGALILGKAAARLGPSHGELWVILLVVLWPLGFHYGRLAAWYSFGFCLVSFLTWSYLKYIEKPSFISWVWVLMGSIALLYSNYLGWAFLAFLVLDIVLRDRAVRGKQWMPILSAGLIALVTYVPLYRPLLHELQHGPHIERTFTVRAFGGLYNLYCLFVSESVAPWVWVLGIPVGIAIAVCFAIGVVKSPSKARHFLLYFSALFGLMAFMGIETTKRSLLVAPWLILPVGVTLATIEPGWPRRSLVTSLFLIAAVGWYGTLARNLYAAPHWIEPWSDVAHGAANEVRNGGTVIADNAAFFFYLTYLLPPTDSKTGQNFAGLLPDSVHRDGVFSPRQWTDAGHPTTTTTMLVKGMHFGTPEAVAQEPQLWLDRHCSLQARQRLIRDFGSELKQRYWHVVAQPEWRIEIDTYSCKAS